MEDYRMQRLSDSSRHALKWAVTRARKRASSDKDGYPSLVSPTDMLVGVLLVHPNRSDPHQLFEHFQIPPERLYDALRATGGFAPDDKPKGPEPLDAMPELDTGAEIVLDKSFELAQEYNPKEKGLVRLRDLFGGILMTPNEAHDTLQQALSGASVSLETVAASYPEFLRYPSEMSYTQFLAEQFPLTMEAELPPSIRFAVSGFSADTRTERDLVGIGAEVDAFAYLIAAKALQPPLAIGLFGDWGSGKSFFMEALRKRIHKITKDAKLSGQPQGKISIYKYIAQIEFNAWHYVEGELWASLVEHIFRNLQTRPEDELTLLQQRQQHWIEKLEVARRAQQAAQARKASLEDQLSQTQDRITTLEQEREDTLKRLNELKARDVFEAVQLSESEKDNITQTMRDLGVTKTYQSAAELMLGIEELRDVLRRGNALTTPLRERSWKWATALIVVILIGPAVSFALTGIGDVPAVTNALVSVSAFLSGLTVMLKQGTSWLSSAIARVEGAQFRLDAKRREVEEKYATEIAEAERQHAEKAAEYEQAKSEEQVIEREIAELEQELQRITPGRVLLDFVNERVGSQDYRKHLGIAALIRRDFDQLSQLIAEQNQKFIEKDDGTEREENQYLINRIVLYIDDLDRCPPERVVQVLQAVHLLLAFPLFVVVVAVDARWLTQSLQKHYEDLLIAAHQQEGLELSEGFVRQASPQDYLEKIFQVPFWVRPLPEKARIRIVQGLVAESLVPLSTESADSDDKPPPEGQESDSEKSVAARAEERAVVHWEASERGRPLKVDAETDLTPHSLDIQELELRFMEELRAILGETPRSVKRFVNVYRLIKAVSLNQTAKFVEDRPDADFKLVLFLLAVLTGLPAISREFFRLLREERSEIEQARAGDRQAPAPSGRTLAKVLEELRRVILGEPKASPTDTLPSGQEAAATSEPGGDGQQSSPRYEDWDALRDLERLETWTKQYDHGSWLNFDATVLADWTPQVARFSYRIEEL